MVPGTRQGRQDGKLATMALHQHLGDSGGGSEVTVDLEDERRMQVNQIKQIGRGRVAEQMDYIVMGQVYFTQSCPHRDYPGEAATSKSTPMFEPALMQLARRSE